MSEAITVHDCMDFRQRVVLHEGDDVFVERCGMCGAIRYESDGERPMAWFATPTASWPWKYAYDDPCNTPDAPEIWKMEKTDRPANSLPGDTP